MIAAVAIVAMVGCAKEDSDTPTQSSGIVKFCSAEIDTRVTAEGDKWNKDEEIGISMYTVTTVTNENDTENLTNVNVKYVSTNDDDEQTSVDFEAETEASSLLYPNTGSVKFYAYYPFQTTLTSDYLYTAVVSDQSKNVDFMVASTNVVDRYTGTHVLAFAHKLTKITFEITGNDNAEDVSGLSAVSVVGLSTTGSYDIRTGELSGSLSGNTTAIDFVVDSNCGSTSTVYATAIVHPETLSDAAVVTFTIDGGSDPDRNFLLNIPKNTQFLASSNHKYSVALGNDIAEFKGNSIIEGWSDKSEDELYTTEIK